MSDFLGEAIERAGRAVMKSAPYPVEITGGDLYELLLAARRWNQLEKAYKVYQTVPEMKWRDFIARFEKLISSMEIE